MLKGNRSCVSTTPNWTFIIDYSTFNIYSAVPFPASSPSITVGNRMGTLREINIEYRILNNQC